MFCKKCVDNNDVVCRECKNDVLLRTQDVVADEAKVVITPFPWKAIASNVVGSRVALDVPTNRDLSPPLSPSVWIESRRVVAAYAFNENEWRIKPFAPPVLRPKPPPVGTVLSSKPMPARPSHPNVWSQTLLLLEQLSNNSNSSGIHKRSSLKANSNVNYDDDDDDDNEEEEEEDVVFVSNLRCFATLWKQDGWPRFNSYYSVLRVNNIIYVMMRFTTPFAFTFGNSFEEKSTINHEWDTSHYAVVRGDLSDRVTLISCNEIDAVARREDGAVMSNFRELKLGALVGAARREAAFYQLFFSGTPKLLYVEEKRRSGGGEKRRADESIVGQMGALLQSDLEPRDVEKSLRCLELMHLALSEQLPKNRAAFLEIDAKQRRVNLHLAKPDSTSEWAHIPSQFYQYYFAK